MKVVIFCIILVLMSGALIDCLVPGPLFGPPTPRAEVIIGSPGPGYFWIGGYWVWSGSAYHWAPGHWAKRRPGREWVPGRWEQRGRRWVWRRGFWR
jgi:hypothetical protein